MAATVERMDGMVALVAQQVEEHADLAWKMTPREKDRRARRWISADDQRQEAMLGLILEVRRLGRPLSVPEAFLAMRRQVVDAWRSRMGAERKNRRRLEARRATQAFHDLADPRGDRGVLEVEAEMDAMHVLDRLRTWVLPESRAVAALRLRYIEEWEPGPICRLLGVSRDTLNHMLCSARVQARQAVAHRPLRSRR